MRDRTPSLSLYSLQWPVIPNFLIYVFDLGGYCFTHPDVSTFRVAQYSVVDDNSPVSLNSVFSRLNYLSAILPCSFLHYLFVVNSTALGELIPGILSQVIAHSRLSVSNEAKPNRFIDSWLIWSWSHLAETLYQFGEGG